MFAVVAEVCRPKSFAGLFGAAGQEMRHHKRLTQNIGVDAYFAHPRAPWERGINENTNGLPRQYLPKGTDLSVFSQERNWAATGSI
jgi:IS30 family transposase